MRSHNDTVLDPIVYSPLLKAVGVGSRFEKAVTMEQWVKAKQASQLNSEIVAKKYEHSGDRLEELIARFKDRKMLEMAIKFDRNMN